LAVRKSLWGVQDSNLRTHKHAPRWLPTTPSTPQYISLKPPENVKVLPCSSAIKIGKVLPLKNVISTVSEEFFYDISFHPACRSWQMSTFRCLIRLFNTHKKRMKNYVTYPMILWTHSRFSPTFGTMASWQQFVLQPTNTLFGTTTCIPVFLYMLENGHQLSLRSFKYFLEP